MEYYDCGDGLPKARPSGISIPCNSCGNGMPFDPSNPEGLCSNCNSGIMAQRTPTTMQQSSNFTGKRSPLKRDLTTTNPIVRYSVMGPAAQMNSTLTTSHESDDGSDDFVDAPEAIQSDDDDGDSVAGSGSADEDQNGLEAENEVAARELEADAEEDLFEATFGLRPAGDDEEEDDEGRARRLSTPPDDGGPATMTLEAKGSYKEFLKAEAAGHTKGCKDNNRSRRHSTPPDNNNNNIKMAGPVPPDPINDLSNNLKQLKTFHNRAIQLIPRLPLAAHRYWIGVLNLDVNPKYFSTEKNFTWMKGNRFSTVETVWHMYKETAATDDFVLLLGTERADFGTMVQELDYFNCKKVMFRAVQRGKAGWKGRSLTEGLIPEVQVQEKVVSREVIEID